VGVGGAAGAPRAVRPGGFRHSTEGRLEIRWYLVFKRTSAGTLANEAFAWSIAVHNT